MRQGQDATRSVRFDLDDDPVVTRIELRHREREDQAPGADDLEVFAQPLSLTPSRQSVIVQVPPTRASISVRLLSLVGAVKSHLRVVSGWIRASKTRPGVASNRRVMRKIGDGSAVMKAHLSVRRRLGP